MILQFVWLRKFNFLLHLRLIISDLYWRRCNFLISKPHWQAIGRFFTFLPKKKIILLYFYWNKNDNIYKMKGKKNRVKLNGQSGHKKKQYRSIESQQFLLELKHVVSKPYTRLIIGFFTKKFSIQRRRSHKRLR